MWYPFFAHVLTPFLFLILQQKNESRHFFSVYFHLTSCKPDSGLPLRVSYSFLSPASRPVISSAQAGTKPAPRATRWEARWEGEVP